MDMKLTKQQRDLMKDLGKRGGLAAQRKRSTEEKRLHAVEMNRARWSKAAKDLNDPKQDAITDVSNN